MDFINSMRFPFIIVMGISLIALATAFWLINWVMAKDTGTDAMRKISDAIKAGAEAYLRRQNYTIISLSGVLAVVIFVLYAFVRKHNEHDPANSMQLALCTTASFVAGAACSLIAGYIGMCVASILIIVSINVIALLPLGESASGQLPIIIPFAVSTVVALVLGWLCGKFFENQSYQSLGASFTNGWLAHLAVGLAVGAKWTTNCEPLAIPT